MLSFALFVFFHSPQGELINEDLYAIAHNKDMTI